MAQLDFYATEYDFRSILEFVFEETDIRVFDAYSRIDKEIREFRDLNQLLESDHLVKNHGRFFLRGWSSSVVKEQRVKRIRLEPSTGKFRYSVEGPAVIQFLQGSIREDLDNALYWSTISHWNEAGAYQRAACSDSELDSVDWKMLRRISGRIQRHVRSKLAVAKVDSRPVLENAHDFLRSGRKLWFGPEAIGIDSARLKVIESRVGAA